MTKRRGSVLRSAVALLAVTAGGASAMHRSPHGDHGRIEWFEGSFEEALAEAAKNRKIVFIDFWTRNCPWCTRLDRDTFIETSVKDEARSFVCLPIDGESEAGRPIAERYGIRSWPSLVFLEADGTLRDRLSGFRGAGQLVLEFHRIQSGLGTFGEVERRAAARPKDVVARLDLVLRLQDLGDERAAAELRVALEGIARGEGFDAASPDDRYAIARRLRPCGEKKGYAEQIAAIRRLDPEGRSAPARSLALSELLGGFGARLRAGGSFEPAEVEGFLAAEAHPSVLFEGFAALRDLALGSAAQAGKRGDAAAAAGLRARARGFAQEAWKSCPADRTADFGREVAEDLLGAAGELDDAGRAFAVEVASKASASVPQSVDHLETLASCLELVGRREEASATLQRARAIDPTRPSLRKRLDAATR